MLPQSLYTAHDTRELDRLTVECAGIPEITLMNRAGERAFRVLRETWPAAKNFAVVCGPGNNGGDGFVLARLAKLAGLKPIVLFVGEEARLKGAALKAFGELKTINATVAIFSAEKLAGCDVIIDAMFGTGLREELTGRFAAAARALNAFGKPVLAVDIPSGLNADTGCVMGVAVKAEVTVSFIGLKRGLFTQDGPDFTGEVVYESLEVPDSVLMKVRPAVKLLDWREERRRLALRPRNAHKGLYGHVLVIGGDLGMSGAARLAGEAALKTGAGLVSIATRPEHAPFISAACPELMSHPVGEAKSLKDLLARATVVALGPGLGRSEWSHKMWQTALDADVPVIVDADGLNLLAEKPRRRGDWILTPHPGEAARLIGCEVAQVSADRFAAVQKIREIFGGTIVLKGCGTIIAASDGAPLDVCPYGNPAMATAGMGDVLTGIIAGFVAQSLAPSAAARLGVCVHARAGDQAARGDKRVILALELIGEIATTLAEKDLT